jgi:SAM-dependent methyltransferase
VTDPHTGRRPTRHERRFGSWDNSYDDGLAPWDLGRPQPAVIRLADEGVFSGTVLDAGCGTGEHALLLAARGCEVVGVDVAPTAIEQASEKATDRGIAASFRVADALQLERLGRTFDRVLDMGLFHTFDDDERRGYVESLGRATQTGAVLYLLCFSDRAPGDWGPRRVTQGELRSSFAAGWTVVSITEERIETQFVSDGVPAWLARVDRT